MSQSTRPPEDDEIEKFAAEMRKGNARARLAVLLSIVGVVGALLLLLTLALTSISPTTFMPPPSAKLAQAAPQESDVSMPFTVISTVDASEKRNASTYAVARQAVAVRTSIPGPKGVPAYGSGFVVADGLVITAAHIFTSIPGSEKLPVRVLCEEVERLGTVVAFDPLRDVMAVSVPDCNGMMLTLGDDVPPGDPFLHVSGYTFATKDALAFWFIRSTSIVRHAAPDPKRADIEREFAERLLEMAARHVRPYFGIAGAFIPGNSGSAVFDDSGLVVGMLVATDTRLNRSYVVTMKTIVEVLSESGILIR